MNFENVVLPDSVGFRCVSCGVCCRMQPPDIDRAEQKRIEAKGFKNFAESPDEGGIRWIRRKKDDSCHFLDNNNKCAIYNVRPAACRLEPFTIADYDYEKNRIEVELNFPFSSCCAGTCDGKEIVSVKEIAKAAQAMLQKILAVTAMDLDLPLNDKRVHVETRSRILRRKIEAADLQLYGQGLRIGAGRFASASFRGHRRLIVGLRRFNHFFHGGNLTFYIFSS